MKLVSAAKLRRAQDSATNGRAYSGEIRDIIAALQGSLPADYEHALTRKAKEIRVRRSVVISGERGLCGPYNTNIVKAVTAGEVADKAKSEIVAVGARTVGVAHRLGWSLNAQYQRLPESVSLWPIEEIASGLIKDFVEGKCDEVVIYYTKFVSGLTQVVTREVLLPVPALVSNDSQPATPKCDPAPEILLNNLIPLFIRSRLRQAALESKASEHAARMAAMDSATRNAGELIDKLRLFYNRARQSTITTELIDIVGGAEAIK
jgi:F-type H+-transporting ATPase subunit gamma